MSSSGARTMAFNATGPDAYAALLKAARNVGFAYVSGDASAGTALFTAATRLVLAGEKVAVQIRQATPGTVEVTMSQPGYGFGWAGRKGSGVGRLSDALSQLLPPAEV